jgi:branched-chain amino acid transport system substrate-binding protein
VARCGVVASFAVVVLVALAATGCGGSTNGNGATNAADSGGASGSAACAATVAIEGPFTGQIAALGQEQLHFARLAVARDNAANGTRISLVQGDTQLAPAQAVTVSRQFISNPKVVAVVGPGASQEVAAVGPLFGRVGMAFVSGSATNTTLTSGRNPTFFRVVSKDSVQGPEDARYIIAHLHPKAVMIVDDQESYSTGLASAMSPVFKAAGVSVDYESVGQKVTDFSSLVSRVTPETSVVVLPWQVPANAQQFGRNLSQQHKRAVIFGTDGIYLPGTFTIAGSYVSSLGPDITAIPADRAIAAEARRKYGAFGTAGPPTYAAMHVVDEAIASVCRSGRTPTRATVLAAIRRTDEPTSIIGRPITFDAHGDLIGGKWFVFRIDARGKYTLVAGE